MSLCSLFVFLKDSCGTILLNDMFYQDCYPVCSSYKNGRGFCFASLQKLNEVCLLKHDLAEKTFLRETKKRENLSVVLSCS